MALIHRSPTASWEASEASEPAGTMAASALGAESTMLPLWQLSDATTTRTPGWNRVSSKKSSSSASWRS